MNKILNFLLIIFKHKKNFKILFQICIQIKKVFVTKCNIHFTLIIIIIIIIIIINNKVIDDT